MVLSVAGMQSNIKTVGTGSVEDYSKTMSFRPPPTSAVVHGLPPRPNRLAAILAIGIEANHNTPRAPFGVWRAQVYEPAGPRKITPSRGVLARNVDADGQCLFHCLARLHNRTFGVYKTTTQVIDDIRSYLDEHWDVLSKAHSENDDKTLYLQDVGVRWGGNLEIDAAAERYGVNIFEWTSTGEAANLLSHEQALGDAILSHRYHPTAGNPNELKAFASWDLFLHRGHFRYLEKTTSDRVHEEAAEQIEKPFERLPRTRKPVPPKGTMNDALRYAAEERAARQRRANADQVCYTRPMADLNEEATERLVRELVAREEQEESDARMAHRLASQS